MNQELKQIKQELREQARKELVLQKANYLVQNRRVRRSPCAESRNIWIVGSYSTPNKWYVVRWNDELDGFTCVCKAWQYSSDNVCIHILACSIFEGETH